MLEPVTEQSVIERLRVNKNPYGQDGSEVVAIDIGSEFTKVSFWNKEDGCSSTLHLGSSELVPTMISYSVLFARYNAI